MRSLQLNLILAWVWIWLGFLSGLGLGLFFHRADWLGGYASLQRRLYRLCHISFFGLGVLNLCFYLTAQESRITGPPLTVASWAFIAGAVAMPACCLLMAHFPRTRLLFGLPVVTLLVGGALTVIAVGITGHSSFRTSAKGSPALNSAAFKEGFSKHGLRPEKLQQKAKDSAI